MSLKDDFQKLGLSQNESEVYFILLNKGPKSFHELVDLKVIANDPLSKTLTSLIKKGLIEINVNKDQDLYEPTSPYNFQVMVEHDRRLSLDEKTLLNSIFPIVLNLYNLHVQKQKIKCLEGKEGMKVIYEDILAEIKDEILVFRSVYDDPLSGYLNKYYTEKRARAGIATRMIVNKPPTPETLENDKRLLRQRQSLPIDLPCEIDIYGDRVSFLSYRTKLAAMTIEDKDLSDSLRNIFNKMWETASLLKNNNE